MVLLTVSMSSNSFFAVSDDGDDINIKPEIKEKKEKKKKGLLLFVRLLQLIFIL